MSYKIENSSKHLGDKGNTSWWEWSAYLSADGDDLLSDVESVDYMLHPSFPSPLRHTSDIDTRFAITARGWGVFMVRAEVNFKNKEKPSISLTHQLQFSKGEGE